jgi:hypothetical protein
MNTKLLKATIGLTIVMMVASACGLMPVFGSRNLISETRTVSGYDKVDVSGGGSLNIIQDGTESLTVETDDNMMQYITSQVRGGTLYLGLHTVGQSVSPSALNFTLHVKDLSGINTSGSWDVTSAALKGVNLEIVLSGSGKVRVDSVTLTTLSVTSSGSANVTVAGKTDSQTISISGSGKYAAGDLSSQSARITISGSGNVTVWATSSLTAHVSGSGDVSYYGSPQVSFDQSGSGSIHNLGTK